MSRSADKKVAKKPCSKDFHRRKSFLFFILQITVQYKRERIDVLVVCPQFFHIHPVARIRVALFVIEEYVRYILPADDMLPAQRNILHIEFLQRERIHTAGKVVSQFVQIAVEKGKAPAFEVQTYAIRTPRQKGIRRFCHIIFHDCLFRFQK